MQWQDENYSKEWIYVLLYKFSCCILCMCLRKTQSNILILNWFNLHPMCLQNQSMLENIATPYFGQDIYQQNSLLCFSAHSCHAATLLQQNINRQQHYTSIKLRKVPTCPLLFLILNREIEYQTSDNILQHCQGWPGAAQIKNNKEHL